MQHTVFAWYPFLQMMFSRHSIQKMHNGTTGEKIARPKCYSTERRRYAESMRKRDTQNINIGTYKNLNLFTLSYSSEINTVLCSQRVSLLLRKTPWCVLRGLWPLVHFFQIWTCWVGGGSPLQTNNGCLKSVPNGPYYLQPAATPTPDQITQQNSLQGAWGPSRQ